VQQEGQGRDQYGLFFHNGIYCSIKIQRNPLIDFGFICSVSGPFGRGIFKTKKNQKRGKIIIFEREKCQIDMDTESLKLDIIQWLTQLKDKNVLEKIRAIKEEEGFELSVSQQEELDNRLEKYGRGEMKFKTFEQTKASVRERSKSKLKLSVHVKY